MKVTNMAVRKTGKKQKKKKEKKKKKKIRGEMCLPSFVLLLFMVYIHGIALIYSLTFFILFFFLE